MLRGCEHLWRAWRSSATQTPGETTVVGLEMKPVGEPYAGNPHVRFDERGVETERWPHGPKQPRLSSTLPLRPAFQRESKPGLADLDEVAVGAACEVGHQLYQRMALRHVFLRRPGGAHSGDILFGQQPAQQQFLIRYALSIEVAPHLGDARIRAGLRRDFAR